MATFPAWTVGGGVRRVGVIVASGPGEALGQRVRVRRKALGLSQQELAARIRVSQPRISQIERGRPARPLPLRTLCELADVLKVGLDDLIAGDPAYELIELKDARGSRSSLAASPRAPAELVGRAGEVAAVIALVRAGTRLLTLVGPGGVGKTQLAVRVANELAHDFPARRFFVSVAACRDPGSVVAAIARAVGLRERDARPLRTRLLSDLPHGRALLVLDNVEQVAAAAATLTAELLAAYPDLTLLVTSRAPLNVQAERRYAVLPLTLPEATPAVTVAAAAAAAAVRLFVQRAQEVVPDFSITQANAAQIAAICRRLDGLPLAIELAAPRMRVYSPRQLLEQLEHRVTFLSGSRDLPSRQQSLRASMEWSFDLLTPDQQMLLRRLAVFVGGFTLVAADVVTNSPPDRGDADRWLSEARPAPVTVADDIQALLDQNLLIRVQQGDGAPRFAMLETIHDFAAERVTASGEWTQLRQRHLRWMIGLAERADSALFGFEQDPWLRRLDAEWENARAALSWAIETREATAALRLTAALTDYWYLRGMLSEGTGWLDEVLALTPPTPRDKDVAMARVRALAAASQLAQPYGDLAKAGALAEQALALAREIGDRQGEARALALLGNHALVQDDLERAASWHRRALTLFRKLGGHRRWVIAGLNNLSQIAYEQGDNREALALASEALTWARQAGDAWGLTLAQQRLGDAALGLGQIRRAASHIAQSLAHNRSQQLDWGIANAVAAGASLATAAGMPLRGVRLFAAASARYQPLGVRIPPKLRPDWTTMLDRARAAIGGDPAARAWAAGSQLTAEEAIAEALAIAVQIAQGGAGLPMSPQAARRPQRPRANARVRKRGTHPIRS
jgi:predicted ATPase/transcriptional regulator with XRE-family HTH domain